jgi:Ca-activated chloride channel homolog
MFFSPYPFTKLVLLAFSLVVCVACPCFSWAQPAIKSVANTTGVGAPPQQVLIIFDASGSMAERLPTGETKLEAAKLAINQLVQNMPSNTSVGLRVYGSSRWAGCASGRLMVPMGTNNAADIKDSMAQVFAFGSTPISMNLIEAVNHDFIPNVNTKRSIILVSDGAETCAADPCAVALDMVRHNVQISIDVVGFGSLQFEDIRQLRCIAAATFGKFSHAKTAAELLPTLNRSVQTKSEVAGQILLPGKEASVSNTPYYSSPAGKTTTTPKAGKSASTNKAPKKVKQPTWQEPQIDLKHL